jgi:hypothetical protein
MKSQRFVKALVKKKQILVAMSLLHTILGFIVVACILSFSFDINLPYVDLMASLVPISFVIFRRCIHLDACEFIKNGEKMPEYTEDGYFFNKLQRYIFNTEILSKTELRDFKGGDIGDVEHFCSIDDENIIKGIFNEKVHYITINSIIIVVLAAKYNMKKFIPMYLAWFFYNFS